MFVFGTTHNWQGDAGVKQILVFPNEAMAEVFEKDFAVLVDEKGIEEASDSNLGAIYKLRAIKNSVDNEWIPLIRCGISGESLWEGYNKYPTPYYALYEAYLKLKELVLESMPAKELKLFM